MSLVWYPGMSTDGSDPMVKKRLQLFEKIHEEGGRIKGMTRVPNLTQAFLWLYKKKTKQRFQNGKPMFLINYLLPIIAAWFLTTIIYGMVDPILLKAIFLVLCFHLVVSILSLIFGYSNGPLKEIEKETARVLLSGEADKWTQEEKTRFIEELLLDKYKKFKKDSVIYFRNWNEDIYLRSNGYRGD